ncbi:alpha/beta-hydrolase [Rhypophila decipiens]
MTPNATKLSTTIIDPSSRQGHTHTIIFLHGRGDNAKNLARSLGYSTSSTGQTLMQHFPFARWVFPSSELRPSARLANTFGGGMTSQWFDTWHVQNLSHREELQMPGLAESVASVLDIIHDEVKLLSGRWDRLVLAGISQGGAVVMHCLLNLATPTRDVSRIGGVMGFSCRFPFPGRTLNETRKIVGVWQDGDEDGLIRNTPVLIEHCLDDPLVKVNTGRQVRDVMTGFGARVTWKEYDSGGHWISSPQGVDDAVAWLGEHVFVEEA